MVLESGADEFPSFEQEIDDLAVSKSDEDGRVLNDQIGESQTWGLRWHAYESARVDGSNTATANVSNRFICVSVTSETCGDRQRAAP